MLNMIYLFFNLGGGEIFVVLMFVLLFFGSKRIPDVARNLGRGIRQFKNATEDIQRDITDSVSEVKKSIDQEKDKK
ncbi:twin-arginine translocase TatA/TatE family subunit [Salibacteraceae bacterium]|jgi:sec-independent protein translocase protein TatA|nr:twin-arginine translocase TatA/TatE family subunit [Salibacteraceae bacterium]MDB9710046.1 twin-arginine translocase TatA/TatE family subunit [Salibacteraceae bacterium]